MAKCLVTGAAGFIGYHLCERLCSLGEWVLGVDNINSYYNTRLKQDRITRLAERRNFEFRKIELSDRSAVADLFQSQLFDVVYHLAAQAGVRYSITNPHAYIDSNILGFANVLEESRLHQSDHVIYASSSSVYGKGANPPFSEDELLDAPESLYAATKRSNELMAATYAKLHGMRITGLRFFTVYGPWGRPDMAIYRFVEQMTRKEPIDVYNHGRMARDFTYVDDIVDGVVNSGRAPLMELGNASMHRIYNLGNNRPVELLDLIAHIEKALGCTAEKRFLPMQPGEVLSTCADINKAKKEIGYHPRVAIEDGIGRFVAWYREYSNSEATLARSGL